MFFFSMPVKSELKDHCYCRVTSDYYSYTKSLTKLNDEILNEDASKICIWTTYEEFNFLNQKQKIMNKAVVFKPWIIQFISYL